MLTRLSGVSLSTRTSPAATPPEHRTASRGLWARRVGVPIVLLLGVLLMSGCNVLSFGGFKGVTVQGKDEYKLWQGMLIAGFIVGTRDNAISNRDREHAAEWREIGAKLREDRAELRETIAKGLHNEIDAFLKDMTRGWQPVPSQRARKEEETKEQFYGEAIPDYMKGQAARRDLPANAQPTWDELGLNTASQGPAKPSWRDLDPREIMPPGAHYRTDFATGKTQVDENSIRREKKREGEALEEVTEAKAAQLNKEDTTFDQDAYDNYWKSVSQETGRSRGGMSR